MGTINKVREPRTETEKHLNWMGGASYFLANPVNTLRMAAASCFFGEPMYYHSEKEPAEAPRALSMGALEHLRAQLGALDPQAWRTMTPAALMVSAIDAALDHDPEATLKLAVELRQVHNIRTTPQVILVRAAHHPRVRGGEPRALAVGTGLVRRYAREICVRGDEPSVGLAYHLATYGKDAPIPNSLKKAWRLCLESLSEYEVAKYRMEKRQVKTVDVVNLVHPRGSVVDGLVRGKLTTDNRTWESIVSKEGSTKEAWSKAVHVMGHMAILRNLRNFHEKDLPLGLYAEKLKAGVLVGKQLPFRYFSAYKALEAAKASGPLLDLVEECLMLSLVNLPLFAGRAMFLCDNSGSAWGTTSSSMGTMRVAEIANLTGVIGGQLCDEGYLGLFGDKLITKPIRKRSSVFDQTNNACRTGLDEVGQGTENGVWLFWRDAIRDRQRWDHVFIMSDMQAGHGGLYGADEAEYRDFRWGAHHIDVAKLINAYRSKVNPHVNVYLVQVAGYKDTIVPEFYDRTYILGGWSDSLFRFAAEMSKIRVEAERPRQ